MTPTRRPFRSLDRLEGTVGPHHHVEVVDPQHGDRAQVLVRIQVLLDAAAVCQVHDVGLGEAEVPLPGVHRRHHEDATRGRLEVDVGLGERVVEALDQIVGELRRRAGPQRELLRPWRRGPRRAGGGATARRAAPRRRPHAGRTGIGMTSSAMESSPRERSRIIRELAISRRKRPMTIDDKCGRLNGCGPLLIIRPRSAGRPFR